MLHAWLNRWCSKPVALLLAGLSAGLASAASYTLPGSLPAGCTAVSATSVTCSSLSLNYGDILRVSNANLTLTVTNTLNLGGNDINITSPATGFSLQANSVSASNFIRLTGNITATNNLSLGSNTNSITGNVSAGGNINIGGTVTGALSAGGNLTTVYASTITGAVVADSITSGGGSRYGGNLSATAGSVTTGSGDTLSGNVSATAGAVTLKSSATTVAGNVLARDAVTLESGTSVAGSVTSTQGAVTLNSSGSSVGAGISASKTVTLGSGCTVTGDISTDEDVSLQSSNSKVNGNILAKKKVTLGSSTWVTGKVSSSNSDVILQSASARVDSCISVDAQQTINLGWQAAVGGVCCLSSSGSCTSTCVANNSGLATPALCQGSCIGDSYSSGTLNTALWNVSGVGFTPLVVNPPAVASSRLRLTDSVSNRATFAQFKKWFPSANNKVVVEFDFYAWGGSGADGVTVVFSDASVSPAPGGYGGSLGYANRTGIDGFGGGWLGIGLDEFGNFPGTGEGRRGYPSAYTAPVGANVAAIASKNVIAVRGSGLGQNSGYALLANTGTIAPGVSTGTSGTDSSTKHRYRITLDNANGINAFLKVERDTSGSGNSYSTVIPAFDLKKTGSGQAAVPTNMLLSFTGSTGGSTNNHEIGNVRVCATTITEVGSSSPAANFECMDGYLAESSYNNLTTSPASRNPIYTKLARTGFNLRVVPLAASGAIKTDYIPAGGSSKNVTVELFDDSSTPRPACSAFSSALASQSVTLTSGVAFLTSNFTVNKAYPKLMCRVTDNSTATPVYGCSSDAFAVRPGAVSLSTSASALAPSASATPVVKAGANFTLQAVTSTASTDGYTGSLTQVAAQLTAQASSSDLTQTTGGVVGGLTPASLSANTSASNNASYSEAGYLYLAAGAYADSSYTAVDGSTDCVSGSTNVTLSSGKYGCVIGNTVAVSLGRFIPDHFTLTSSSFTPACGSFSYMGQTFGLSATLQAQNASGGKTSNFSGVFANASVVAELENANDGASLAVSRLTGLGSPNWTAGAYPFVATGFSRPIPPAPPDGAFDSLDIGLKVLPLLVSDNASLINRDMASGNTTCTADVAGTSNGSCTAVRIAAGAKVRFGRLRLENAFGSEKLALQVPLQAQYWNGAYFVSNPLDSCTALSVPAAQTLATGAAPAGLAGLYFYPLVAGKNQLLSTDAVPTLVSPLTAGKSQLQFAAPQKRGWLDLILAVPDHLKGNWGNCSGQTGGAGLHDDLPCSRVTFGVYGSKSPVIYRRENY